MRARSAGSRRYSFSASGRYSKAILRISCGRRSRTSRSSGRCSSRCSRKPSLSAMPSSTATVSVPLRARNCASRGASVWRQAASSGVSGRRWPRLARKSRSTTARAAASKLCPSAASCSSTASAAADGGSRNGCAGIARILSSSQGNCRRASCRSRSSAGCGLSASKSAAISFTDSKQARTGSATRASCLRLMRLTCFRRRPSWRRSDQDTRGSGSSSVLGKASQSAR